MVLGSRLSSLASVVSYAAAGASASGGRLAAGWGALAVLHWVSPLHHASSGRPLSRDDKVPRESGSLHDLLAYSELAPQHFCHVLLVKESR